MEDSNTSLNQSCKMSIEEGKGTKTKNIKTVKAPATVICSRAEL